MKLQSAHRRWIYLGCLCLPLFMYVVSHKQVWARDCGGVQGNTVIAYASRVRSNRDRPSKLEWNVRTRYCLSSGQYLCSLTNVWTRVASGSRWLFLYAFIENAFPCCISKAVRNLVVWWTDLKQLLRPSQIAIDEMTYHLTKQHQTPVCSTFTDIMGSCWVWPTNYTCEAYFCSHANDPFVLCCTTGTVALMSLPTHHWEPD